MDISQWVDAMLAERRRKADLLDQQRARLKDLQADLRNRQVMLHAIQLSPDRSRTDSVQTAFPQEALIHEEMTQLREQMLQIDMLTNRYDTIIDRFRRDHINIVMWNDPKPYTGIYAAPEAADLRERFPELSDACYFFRSSVSAFYWKNTVIFRNDPLIGKGKIRAEIRFRTQEEIAACAAKLIRMLDPDSEAAKMLTFDGIGLIDLAMYEQRTKTKDGDESAYGADCMTAFHDLSSMVNGFSAFHHLAGRPALISDDPEEITQYLKRYDREGRAGGPEYYLWWAVSGVEISCRFRADFGKIRLIDSPTTVDTTSISIADMAAAPEERDADAAVIVRLPFMGDLENRDIDLFVHLKQKYQDSGMEQRLFYLVVGDGREALGYRDALIQRLKVPADHVLLTAWENKEAVVYDFMVPMLERLLDNIESCDNAYIQELADEASRLQKTLQG